MASPLVHEDRLFSPDPTKRGIARRLYQEIKDMPIVSPHGHTDPTWYADNPLFPDPATLLIKPDHYVFRMLYSQGVRLEDLGVPSRDGTKVETDGRKIWRLFAKHYYLFPGTPSRMWLDTVFSTVFGFTEPLTEANADMYYDTIDAALKTEAFRPRALLDRFNIEFIATTEDPLNPLDAHRRVREAKLKTRVVTTFRPDNVTNPEYPHFSENVIKLGELTGEDTAGYKGYLAALRKRRQYFREVGGATATDHGFPSAFTIDLEHDEAEKMFRKAMSGGLTPAESEIFRGHMLMQMAEMSQDDGLVMQIHPGVVRDHNPTIFNRFGMDKGCDIPEACEYTRALKPLLNKFGTNPDFSLIIFTLDEDSYSRELAPLAGHYPAMRLGPAWWFHDSPEGMLRFRERVTETAGFYNTVGFNDDTRAFLSIPARHDVARRIDCVWLARLVAEHRVTEDEALLIARDLTGDLVRKAYRI